MQNYYKYTPEQLDRKQTEIISWLSRNSDNDKRGDAYFALELINCALKLEKDPFILEVIDNLCEWFII